MSRALSATRPGRCRTLSPTVRPAMRRAAFALVFLLALAPGCAYSPLYLAYRTSISRHLPEGVAFGDYVERDLFGRRISVDEKLAELGAYVDADGILRDGAGKRV